MKNPLRSVRWSLVAGGLVGAAIAWPAMGIGTDQGASILVAAVVLAAAGLCIHLIHLHPVHSRVAYADRWRRSA